YLIDAIIAGNVETLVIAHKDRLCRFGFELIEHLCKTHGCDLLVMNMESLSPEQEMIQDMLAIVHCFSARLYGLRNYRKALKKALESDTCTQDQIKPDSRAGNLL
ncbi:recombinase family protein, partial [Dehalococcoidia bacterium]|nr:recombinase family protein [Dehalococcoidia bacterium]